MEDSIGDSVGKYFDLIVGTSTGGIIALGLGLGFTAQEIAALYEELGGKVFAGNRSVRRTLRQLLFAKYSDQPLKEALEAKFGPKRLGESATRLVIPALDLDTGGVHIFKTSHHWRFARDYKEKAVDVALATSAGPTFFPTHRLLTGKPLVDGGLFANNPVGLAVVEAIGVLEWPKESIKVLSLGCTSTPLKVGWGRRLALGFGYLGGKIVDVFMATQSEGRTKAVGK
ncbi:MAG: patatin [Chloroflexi bacterium]|nr:MAG: patatin [Chloroflexota bacterium]